jgi:hypothetical protein
MYEYVYMYCVMTGDNKTEYDRSVHSSHRVPQNEYNRNGQNLQTFSMVMSPTGGSTPGRTDRLTD